MSRLVAIRDRHPASAEEACVHLLIPDDMDLKEEERAWKAWNQGRDRCPYVFLAGFLQFERGCAQATLNDIKQYWYNGNEWSGTCPDSTK